MDRDLTCHDPSSACVLSRYFTPFAYTGSAAGIRTAVANAYSASPVAYASVLMVGNWLQPPSSCCCAARSFAAAAITLALAPLIAAGAAEPDDVVVVAASGTSGAGRAAKAHLLASEVMGDLTPYKVGAHQHVPEIKQATGATSLSMTPVLAPMPRGILATVTAKAAAGDARTALLDAYAGEPFVRVLPEGTWPHTGATAGSNACHLQVTTDLDSRRVVVVSALDNLGKDAAGQAVQCANLMLGLPETAGLSPYGVAP